MIREMLKDCLENRGHGVIETDNGAEAAMLATGTPPSGYTHSIHSFTASP